MSEDIFEQVKKLKKKKKRTAYNIDEDVYDKFDVICKSKKYNKSSIINNFLIAFIEKEESLIK